MRGARRRFGGRWASSRAPWRLSREGRTGRIGPNRRDGSFQRLRGGSDRVELAARIACDRAFRRRSGISRRGRTEVDGSEEAEEIAHPAEIASRRVCFVFFSIFVFAQPRRRCSSSSSSSSTSPPYRPCRERGKMTLWKIRSPFSDPKTPRRNPRAGSRSETFVSKSECRSRTYPGESFKGSADRPTLRVSSTCFDTCLRCAFRTVSRYSCISASVASRSLQRPSKGNSVK
mmetsp:Transcript_21182/g.50287  ORF Transcript_21182/g.50287 Transcript_21182/m.50287 type:complete len:231 (-) Transcript_21182:1051-1743(-)